MLWQFLEPKYKKASISDGGKYTILTTTRGAHFKGGDIEPKLCEQLSIPSKNIDELGALKATSPGPFGELTEHYAFLHRR